MSTLRVTNIQDLAGNSVFVLSGGNATIAGDLTVQGTTTSIETTNLTVEDKNIVLGLTDPAATDATADGGGITLKGTTDKTITWSNTSGSWETNVGFNVLSGNVGIGTTDPSSIVDIKLNDASTTIGGSASVVRVNNGVGQLGATSGLEFFHGNDTSSNAKRLAAVYGRYDQFNAAGLGGELIFATNTPGDATIDERMRIDATGNVGIGTTSPGAKFEVIEGDNEWRFKSDTEYAELRIRSANGKIARVLFGDQADGARGAIQYDSSDDSLQLRGYNNTERARIDSSGRLLVGTVSAYSPVGFAHLLQIEGTASTSSSLSITRSDTTIGGTLTLAKANGGIGGNDTVTTGEALGQILFNGSNGTNRNNYSARILAQAEGTFTTSSCPAHLSFWTTSDGATSPTERMRIDSAGKVGFSDYPREGNNVRFANSITGATNMDSVINIGIIQTDVTGSVNGFKTYLSSISGTRTTNEINHFAALKGTYGTGHTVTSQRGYFAHSGLTGATNNYGFYGEIATGTGRWNFYASGSAANYFAGNVGIGTNDPSAKLHIETASAQGWQLRLDSVGLSNESGFYRDANDNYEVVLRSGDGALSYIKNSGGVGAANLFFHVQGSDRLNINSSGNIGIGTNTQGSRLAVNGSITESTDGGTTYHNVVTAQDVGTDPNQVPLNQFLGQLAFMDEIGDVPTAASAPQENYAVNFEYVSDTSLKIRMRGSDGVVRSVTLTLS